MGCCWPQHPAAVATGPAPPRRRQEAPAGCCRLWTHPASPAQGQRKGVFLFAGAVGSGTRLPWRLSSGKTWPCLGAATSCPPPQRGDSPVTDIGLCSVCGPSWVGEFCVRCWVLLQRRSCLSLGRGWLTPVSTPPLAIPARAVGFWGRILPARQNPCLFLPHLLFKLERKSSASGPFSERLGYL